MITFGDNMGVTFQAYCAGETQAARPCLRSPCCPVWSSPSGGGRGGTCGVCQRERTVHVTGSGGAVKTRLVLGLAGDTASSQSGCAGNQRTPVLPSKPYPASEPIQSKLRSW